MSQSKPLDLLFDPALIPSKVQSLLGDDLLLRPLASDDQTRGFFELLSVLTAAPKLSAQKFKDVFETLKRSNGIYYTIVIVHKASDKLVAAGTIVLEHKFIRNAGIVGHIEDIVVSRELQGRKLGLRIIDALGEIGAATGCYKIILDCDQKNVAFYEKCGYSNKGIQMAKYTSDPAGPKSPITPKL